MNVNTVFSWKRFKIILKKEQIVAELDVLHADFNILPTFADLSAVDELMKHYSRWLGFLPMEALQDYLEKGTVLGAKNVMVANSLATFSTRTAQHISGLLISVYWKSTKVKTLQRSCSIA